MATDHIKRKPSILPGWEKKLADLLKELGAIPGDFSGKLNISFHQGGVAACEVVNKLK